MKIKHTQSRKGRRGHKMFPGTSSTRRLQLEATKSVLISALLAAFSRRR